MDTARDKFHIGQKVKPSTHGVLQGIFSTRALLAFYEVIGFSRDNPSIVRVRKETENGLTYCKSYHMKFFDGEAQLEPTHITTGGKTARFVIRHPSQIEREKQECAYYLNVCWPSICADEPTPDSTNNEQTPP
jgi:hypothetical protein